MRHIAAYLLLQLGGNVSPSAEDIKKLLSVVGIEADDARLESLVAQLKEKDINELIQEGSKKLASVPSGTASKQASTVAVGGQEAGKDQDEQDPQGEESDSDSDFGGFGLFGD